MDESCLETFISRKSRKQQSSEQDQYQFAKFHQMGIARQLHGSSVEQPGYNLAFRAWTADQFNCWHWTHEVEQLKLLRLVEQLKFLMVECWTVDCFRIVNYCCMMYYDHSMMYDAELLNILKTEHLIPAILHSIFRGGYGGVCMGGRMSVIQWKLQLFQANSYMLNPKP